MIWNNTLKTHVISRFVLFVCYTTKHLKTFLFLLLVSCNFAFITRISKTSTFSPVTLETKAKRKRKRRRCDKQRDQNPLLPANNNPAIQPVLKKKRILTRINRQISKTTKPTEKWSEVLNFAEKQVAKNLIPRNCVVLCSEGLTLTKHPQTDEHAVAWATRVLRGRRDADIPDIEFLRIPCTKPRLRVYHVRTYFTYITITSHRVAGPCF